MFESPITRTIVFSFLTFGVASSVLAAPAPLAAPQARFLSEDPKGEPVDVDKLPKAVVEGLKKAMPGARIVKALKLEDGNYFLDDVKVGKKEYDVTISPEGKVIKSIEQQQD